MLSLVFTSRICGESLRPINRAVNQLRPDCLSFPVHNVRLCVVFAGLGLGDFVDVAVKRIARDTALNILCRADIAIVGADVLNPRLGNFSEVRFEHAPGNIELSAGKNCIYYTFTVVCEFTVGYNPAVSLRTYVKRL